MKRGPYRLDHGGSDLNRRHVVHFRFAGRQYSGIAGDTLASALLANGVRTVARSLKFHRPRGIFSCGIEEPNALVGIGVGVAAIPSACAPLVSLHEGLEAHATSGWPNVRWDLGRSLDLVPRLWAAGFYNKAFIWPAWHPYEGLIRRLAGIAKVPKVRDPDRYDVRNAHCDVLIVGAGIEGLRTARLEAQAGQRVILVESAVELGGRSRWDGHQLEGLEASSWISSAKQSLQCHKDVEILCRTTAVSYHDNGVVTLLEQLPAGAGQDAISRERYWIVRTQRLVLATGATEQPLVFCNNDRPGIVLAGAAHEYLKRFGVAMGRRVVVATNNDSAYTVAQQLCMSGVHVIGLVDSRHEVPADLMEQMTALSIPVFSGSIPTDTTGAAGLSSVSIGTLSPGSRQIESQRRLECDAMAVSGGWNRSLQLFSQAGGQLQYEERSGSLQPVGSHPSVEVASHVSDTSTMLLGIRICPGQKTLRQWVDLRHDVTVADLELAIRENYTSIEHVKRYTTVGMSADQGKTSNVIAIEIVARLRGIRPAALGHTTFRPPLVPVTLGAIAGRTRGRFFAPWRLLPMHDWHAAHGAEFEDFGDWRRPAVYRSEGESRQAAIHREIKTVRSARQNRDSRTRRTSVS
jgi:sarcosine oxidase subunit alpha